MRRLSTFAATALLGISATGAQAAVVISTTATANMSCSRGICVPTAKAAVLNVADLEAMLASGPASVSTDGAGAVAYDIIVRSPLGWNSANALQLAAYRSVTIDSSVSVAGTGSLSLYTDNGGKGGALTFGKQGHVAFSSLSSALAINGEDYALYGTIKDLASAIAADPTGNYALAANYDASADGTYTTAPINVFFTGKFEGLGNTIQNLTINDVEGDDVGLFSELQGGMISDIGMTNANVTAAGSVGALLGYNNVSVKNSYSSGTINAVTGQIGGLIGAVGPAGSVDRSHSSVTIAMPNGDAADAAGLVASNVGTITNSYATGAVSGNTAGSSLAGLVSYNDGTIAGSFSTGKVSAGSSFFCGGFVGYNYSDRKNRYFGKIFDSYSTGNLSCDDGEGGFASFNGSGTIQRSYSTGQASGYYSAGFVVSEGKNHPLESDDWDTTTSGTNKGVFRGSREGLKGLTSRQLQSGLPQDFSPKIWAENPNINNGFPYLIANPPPK